MKKLLVFILLSLFSSILFAQSDEILDILYSKERAQVIYTAHIVLQASGDIGLEATIDDTKEFLNSSRWGRSILKEGEFLTKGGFALLIMKSFDLPKGLFYRLFSTKRYALRDMVYNDYILGSPYVNEPISSFDVIYTISSLDLDSNIVTQEIDGDTETVEDSVTVEDEQQ